MAMAPWITPMDVVFSFDTTGSMSLALDEVKARVMDIIQKLQADIPGVRVGIIAHGDYCDAEHFYDIRSLDLSDSVADVVTFVNNTEGTGGGDIPECYELALQVAKNMAWRTVGRRILVMIGDAYPHEPDYHLNVEKIDWRSELAELAAMNVHIYGVQVQNDELSTQFFKDLTAATEGQHLQLANMGRICEVIMGICYREQGPLMFQNYEAEIRQKEADKIGTDLECVFGTLRHEVSRTSDITTILDRDENDVDMPDDNHDDEEVTGNKRPQLKRLHISDSVIDNSDDEEITGNGRPKLKCLRISNSVVGNKDDEEVMGNKRLSLKRSFTDSVVSSDCNFYDDDVVRGNGKPKLKRVLFSDIYSDDDSDGFSNDSSNYDDRSLPIKKRRMKLESVVASHPEPRKGTSGARRSKNQKSPEPRYMLASKSRKSHSSNSSNRPRKTYRELVSLCHFKLNKLNWCPWQLAVCPKQEMKKSWLNKGQWKSVLPASDDRENSLWCTDLLSNTPATRGRSLMFEISVMAPKSHRRKVVSYHMTKAMSGRGVFRLPWYRGVFQSVRPMVNKAAADNSKIFVRWTCVSSRSVKKCQAAVKEYSYAWKALPQRTCF